ncbi:MAG: RAMP superfamily CRISPR-associated protein [Eubacteriales bacterium]
MDTKLKVEITLDSDAIFSSGFPIPGGQDISVYKDELGFPYIKATSFKGLLRESIENIIFWTGQDESIVEDLFGKESLDYEKEHLKFTEFRLKESFRTTTELFSTRVFTALENGVVKEKSLRSAEVVNKGLVFYGQVFCDKEDVELIRQGLNGIKWIGLLRNRGFGKITIQQKEEKYNKTYGENINKVAAASKLYFKIETKLPLVIKDLANSESNNYRTKNYIPGTTIRGMVMTYIANHNPEFFEKNKVKLLQTNFLNGILCKNDMVMIPTIKGFYEDKNEQNLENVVKNGQFSPGKKRASLGNVCAINQGIITYSKTEISAITRIKIEIKKEVEKETEKKSKRENKIFSTEIIDKNQQFEGYIVLDDEELATEITKAFPEEIWLGGDRHQGFGMCKVITIEPVKELHYINAYGYHNQEELQKELYLIAISPFSMMNQKLEPCGICEDELAHKLGVSWVKIKHCSTSVSGYGGFNRQWRTGNSELTMYDEGSIFKLSCSEIPKLDTIVQIQKDGIGFRREEGFGQVLFIRHDIFELISKKEKIDSLEEREEKGKNRRLKIKWIMENERLLWGTNISKSRLGEIQTICERGNSYQLNKYLEEKMESSSPRVRHDYEGIRNFIQKFLQTPSEQTVGVDIEENKLQLLSELFNYTRKEGN